MSLFLRPGKMVTRSCSLASIAMKLIWLFVERNSSMHNEPGKPSYAGLVCCPSETSCRLTVLVETLYWKAILAIVRSEVSCWMMPCWTFWEIWCCFATIGVWAIRVCPHDLQRKRCLRKISNAVRSLIFGILMLTVLWPFLTTSCLPQRGQTLTE